MSTGFLEHPLLHCADLMTTMLRLAAQGPADIDDCLHHLRAMLRRAGERPPVSDAEICERLEQAREALMRAGLLVHSPSDRATGKTIRRIGKFVITGRGRDALARHPRGVDESVLMEFPEYRHYVRAAGARQREEPLEAEYQEGYAACLRGEDRTANPYDFDSARHLAWENGWSLAREGR